MKEEIYRGLINGILPNVSIAINWNQEERAYISSVMRMKKTLNDADLINIEKCLSDGQKQINKAVNDEYPSTVERIIIFTGCWECDPLKVLLKKAGYKISPCGNNFDIWI